MKGNITRLTIRVLDGLFQAGTSKSHPEEKPEHLVTGQKGEEDVYFYLRKNGYVIVARNFRLPRHKGEIDLTGMATSFVSLR